MGLRLGPTAACTGFRAQPRVERLARLCTVTGGAPTPRWKGQRQRWIRSHWKGPDIVVVIEREYEIRE